MSAVEIAFKLEISRIFHPQVNRLLTLNKQCPPQTVVHRRTTHTFAMRGDAGEMLMNSLFTLPLNRLCFA